MSDKAFDRLKTSWNEKHTGLSNAHRMQILEEGTKWTKIGVEPDKAQAIEAQKFTVDDCARIFQIPPHKIGSMEFSKYNNVEQLQIDFVCTTMLYWFRKWEQEVNHKLFMPAERGRMFCEILADAALRGNTEARTAFYASGRQWGYLSINDIRAKENLNPIGPAGDIYLDPLNMVPAGSLLPPEPELEVSPSDEPPTNEPDGEDDPVRTAHRAMLAGQWRRIITQRINGTQKGIKPDFWISHAAYARKVLTDAARVYASVCRADAAKADAAVDAVVREWTASNRAVTIEDAESLAEQLMQQIGGKHAG